jgi:cell wall-associated NlpC family hydrolase
MNKFITYFSCFILVALFFSCASHKKTIYKKHVPPSQSEPQTKKSARHQPEVILSPKTKIVVQQAIQNLGIPYKWGGQSPETGFDCSGLTTYTHKKAGIIIPRTTKAQFSKGRYIEKQNIQVGDLVFFNVPQKKKGWHVGIYIGKGLIIHSPGTGSKVTYGDLNHSYFKKYYIGAKRYL